MGVNDSQADVNHEKLDDLRRGRGPIPEHVIDEFVAGRLSRRDFLRKGTMVGLSVPFLGAVMKATGTEAPRFRTGAPAGRRRVRRSMPASSYRQATSIR